jgi:hypothetical protein
LLALAAELEPDAFHITVAERVTVYKLLAVGFQQTGREAEALNCWQIAQTFEAD